MQEGLRSNEKSQNRPRPKLFGKKWRRGLKVSNDQYTVVNIAGTPRRGQGGLIFGILVVKSGGVGRPAPNVRVAE